MKLPHGDQAIVDSRKLLEYLLNPDHPEGRGHARLFKLLLGIDRSNHRTLVAALQNAARDGEATRGKLSPYGQKFELRFQMTGRNRAFTVLSVWIVTKTDPRPRLVTAYIE